MAISDVFSNVHLLTRWLHVIAGITWIGLLYFFNFVNVPLQGALDDDGKKAVNPKLLPRALWWFRWSAMITFLAGLTLFVQNYMFTPGAGFGPNELFVTDDGIAGRAVWILIGMLFGTYMWFNVWFIIWPAQKAMLTGQVPQDQLPGVRKKAGLASRVNTYLSGPMLFCMLAAPHYGAVSPVTLLVFFGIGVLTIFIAIKASFSVGSSI